MCICHKFKDIDIIPISIAGLDIWDEFTKSFQDRIFTKDERWWLSHMTCKDCGTMWLIGQDERIHDNFCLYRFSKEDLLVFKSEGMWPKYFDKFESMLDLAYSNGYTCRFVDHPNETIAITIELILIDNPTITLRKLQELFNLDSETLNIYLDNHHAKLTH